MTGLWDVVAAGRLRETASLLQRGGEQDTKRELHRMDMNGDNLLILAVRSSNPDLVQLLLDNGSQPDMRSRKTGCSALHEAVRRPPGIDTMRILDLLVERGAYVNLRDKAGQTPLHIATELAFEDAIDYLLSVGGNPTLKDKKGRKPVGIAKANTDSHIFETFFNLDFKKHQERKQKGKRKGGVRKKKDPNQRVFKAILLNRLKDLENTLKVGEKGGVRVNCTSHRGHSPLYLASKLGHLEALKLLIKYGAKPNIMNTSGTTALHAAAEGGHDAVIEVLLEHGAPLDVRDNDKKTPLDLAFQKGKGSTTRLLLNLILSRGQTFSQKRWDWMFRKAAKSGQVDLMQLVMKCSKSLNVNTQTLTGWTPLHIAVRNGQVDAVAFLLSQRGIKTNLGTEANWTPLHVACEYSNADKKMKIMSLLLSQKGTNPNIQNTAGFTPLHMCAKKHDLEGVRLLLEYNANPDIKDNKGWTPLSIAYSEKQQKAKLSSDAEGEVEVEREQMDDEEEVMHCLIEAGANPNQLSFTSRTSPLFEACRVGMERRAEVLIEHGADVNFVMPARKVKRQKRLDTSRDDAGDAEPLPAEGADEMSQAWSVLSLSVLKERSPRIISLLVEKGADVNFTNAKGYTPLHTAVTLANYEVVKILLDAGADPNICNADGTSPLATAFCVAFADKAEVSTVSVAQEGLGQSQSPAASVTRRRQAEQIIEELFRQGARAEAGSGQSYLKLLKTALYGNSTAILASLLAPRADADDVPLVAMEALVSDSSELLNYLLNMRKRKNTQLGHLKQLLTLFIDGRHNGGGADHEDPGVCADLAIACRLDVNMTRAGRTPVHDLVLASVFAVANASKAASALPHASLAFERELIDFLVAKGAQINQPDQNTGFTPLASAVLALSLLKGKTDVCYRDQVLSLIDHLLSLGAVPSLTIVDKRERTWLHHAAQAGDAHNLEKLLALAAKYVGDAGVQGLIAAPDFKGRSALHLALIAGHLPTVTCLLQHGADASACDGKGWSPLQLAYMNKDSTEEQLWSIMTELLAHGADVNCRTSKHTILDLAVGNGRWALAEKLSAMGATLSQGSALLGQKNSRQRWPLLHSVAKSGNCEIAKQILDAKSVDINDMDPHMWTAVHIAVLHGDVNMTRLLLERGADPSQNTNHAWSVLHTAAALRRAKATEELARLKLEKQKRDHRDFKRQERRKAAEAKNAKNADGAVAQPERRPRVSREEFEEAKRKRKEEKAQQAVEDVKADSDAHTNEELSEQLLRVLLEGPGAKTLNINGKDERGRTALDVALLVGNIKGGKVLAAHGGRTHKFGFPNEKGWNDLHRAVFEGELRTVRDILSVLSEPAFSHIIDVNAEDMAGLTPLLLAAMKPNARVVKELLEHGADPAHTDRAGRNCLHHALLRKRRAVVKVIMKHVGDDVVMAKTKDGYTCLDLASTQAFKKMSLHDLVSRNYKKAAVEERPENQHDDREKKVKQGRESMVAHDVAAWGGRKTGKAVALDLFEDWHEWQDDYAREQEEYEAEEEAAANYGEEEGGHNYHHQPNHSIDWSEYLPQPVYPYPLSVPAGPHGGELGGDQVQYGDYPTLYDPSFTYPPGYAEDDAAEATTEVAKWTDGADGAEEDGWTGVSAADWATWGLPNDQSRIADGAGWGEAEADGNPWGEPTDQDPNALPSACPFCGSLWADSDSLTAHALAAHNAHLG